MTLVGERKACAAAIMAFFATIFFLNGIAGPPAFMPMFLCLAIAYFTAFVALVAGYFWGRWYAMGIAFSGVIIAVMLWTQIGLDPIVMIFGGTHGLAALALTGRGPKEAFDGRKDWRERYKLDENGANRLGKAIMRAGASLPYLIMAGLAPRQGQGMGLLLLVGALVFGLFGLRAVVKMRTWGVLALAVAAGLVVAGDIATTSLVSVSVLVMPVAALLLAAAVAPFVKPLVRAFRSAR